MDEQAEGVAGKAVPFPDGPVLALDTSTASMTVAVTSAGEVLGELAERSERNHSVRLLPEIHGLLGGLGLRPEDLQGIAVGCGPGSYTGVRIGVTVAKTFAWALGLPLYGVSSLEALALGGWRDAIAAGALAEDGRPVWIVPALDGRRGQAYTALFAVDAGADIGWRRMSADGIVPFREQAEAWLAAPERAAGTVLFVGETDGAFADVIDAAAAGAQALVLRRPWLMAARDVAAVARRRGAGALVPEAHGLLPNYTQLAEAEAKLLARARVKGAG